MATVNRRELVLEAANRSFALFGYKATTMEQVAKIANVGKGTIYTFFKTKEQLFDEILHHVISDMHQIAQREINQDKPFFDNLFRVVDVLLEFRAQQELLIKLSQEVRDVGTPQSQEALDKVEKVILQYIENKVKLAVDQGEVASCEPSIISFLMLKLYVALASDWNKVYGEPLSKKQIREHFELLLMRGLAKNS